MSKVKHFLRKLHIGDHHQQTTPSQPSTSSLPSPSDLPAAALSLADEAESSFNFFEEEFQVQLALAISVSDPAQSVDDPETAQIDAAKQISLGFSPSQSCSDFLSLRYWSSNVVNYDEQVLDGFYDVCGTSSNLVVQAKMPSLVDLEAISVLDGANYEVVLVNRAIDMELRKLEERVYFMSMEHRDLDRGLKISLLVQKMADLIVDKMGGPVNDVEDMFRRWRVRNYELRMCLNAIVIPLGCLDVGHSRHRALLFKVLADRIKLPCKLVKGSYYTGTDEGAVNLITLDNGSEYIIDLMGAPGTLIPAELPSGHHQTFGLDARHFSPVTVINKSSSTAFDQGARVKSFSSGADGNNKTRNSKSESPSTVVNTKGKGIRRTGMIRTEPLECMIVDLNHPSRGEHELSSFPGKKKPSLQGSENEDVSTSAVTAGKKSEIPRQYSTAISENCVPAREELLLKTELSPVYFTGLRLDKQIPYYGRRKRSAEGMAGQEFELESTGFQPSSETQEGEHILVNGRTDNVIANDGTATDCEELNLSENREKLQIGCSDQSGADMIYNAQMNPVLNGVAEILWEDLHIGERIGIGSYGEVYRAEWNGTEVAVKKFMKQDISGDALTQFKCEVEIMLSLRHPNVVLLTGAVTQPPNMSILTELLPRGSLYKLLHRPHIHIDEQRRIKMALDVAKGMNYLHTRHPIIVHRDLKSPNLLVDNNWVVKVSDFGMSRLQHHTFLSSKSVAGTAEWMAPEVLRNEQSNEKSDVYSFGVILWELATLRVPWTELNSMQVVGAVGFQGRHLDVPPTVDPLVADIIRECWNSNAQARPSFGQIIKRLMHLRQLTVDRSESVCNH
ncbi:serine/threonine-protein kinase EDR1-like isoform X1 [Primulina eburnea]|uniref:serine/threonine-protein kinase EDR1-like isoform X1 n=1 Tax=Primulina eburnea TaxID=1245227 RepID=UPI003C6BF33A